MRAYLAGHAFALAYLATFGTILIERIADAGTILGLAILSSMTVVGVSAVHELTGYALAIVGIGLFGFLFSYWVLVHGPLRGSRLSRVTRDLTERLGAGMNALTSPREALAVTATTLAAALTAVAVAWLAAGAVGVTLTPAQAVLFLSGIVLALAIPAAPGALGTYEFIGVAILTAYGFEPGQALASVVLLRIVTMLPAVTLGLVSAWLLHLRPAIALAASVRRPIPATRLDGV